MLKSHAYAFAALSSLLLGIAIAASCTPCQREVARNVIDLVGVGDAGADADASKDGAK